MWPVKALFESVVLLSLISSVCMLRSVTYRTESGIICLLCPPGTYKAKDCVSDHTHSICQECPPKTYQSIANHAERCQFCTLTCVTPGEAEYVYQECNAFHDMECRCSEGFHRTAGLCLRHTKCPKGQGVVKSGTPDNNTTCEKCRPGFFSPNESLTQICQPCNNCLQGYHEVTPCTAETDRQCAKNEEEDDNTWVIVGGVVAGVVALLIIGVTLFCCCCPRRTITERIKNCREIKSDEKQLNSVKSGMDYMDTSRNPEHDLLADANLTNLSEDLIGQEFLFFFINLFGNPQIDVKKLIEEAEMIYPKSVKRQIFSVFNKWKMLEGQNATAAKIQKALRDYKPDLIEKYAAFFATKDNQVHTNGHAKSIDSDSLEVRLEEKEELLSPRSSVV